MLTPKGRCFRAQFETRLCWGVFTLCMVINKESSKMDPVVPTTRFLYSWGVKGNNKDSGQGLERSLHMQRLY